MPMLTLLPSYEDERSPRDRAEPEPVDSCDAIAIRLLSGVRVCSGGLVRGESAMNGR